MRKKLTKRRSKKIGLPPGSLIHIGEKKVDKVEISIIDYDQDNYSSRKIDDVKEAFPFKETPSVSWLNIVGLHDVETLESIGNHYGIHSLVLEDVLNTQQRPKVEIYDDFIFIVLKMLDYDEKSASTHFEQVSLIVGENYVMTFQECPGDLFDPIRDRIKNKKGRIRKEKSDYLAYTLMDIIIDYYFIIIEKYGERIENLEEKVLDDPSQKLMREIQFIKREMIHLRKSIWPLREAVNTLMRDETSLINDKTIPYIRDLYDHTIQVIDTIESFRDMVSGLLDVHLSNTSNRMNEVMKTLTIIATIFIPLTFIAGIYGMNFEFMPELKWKWAYPALWAMIILIFLGSMQYFRKKKWL